MSIHAHMTYTVSCDHCNNLISKPNYDVNLAIQDAMNRGQLVFDPDRKQKVWECYECRATRVAWSQVIHGTVAQPGRAPAL